MPPTVSRIVVLKAHETGDTSEVIHVLSEAHGRISLFARGIRSAKSRLRGVLQPLALVEATYDLREGEDAAGLRDASELPPVARLAGDLERLTLGMVLAEVAGALAEPGAPAQALFATFLEALGRLDPQSSMRPAEAAALGLLLLLEVGGGEPMIDQSLLRPWPKDQERPRQFWLDIELGVLHARGRQPAAEPAWPLVLPPDAAQIPLPPEAMRFVYDVGEGGQPKALAREHAVQLLDGLLRFAEWQFGHGLRSAAFWRQLGA